ncbi:unnamed protein product [Nesidiocoris tenuis]|uniref:Vesicle tethering protein Uso1/P115-like head domain-containing protein n=1 Tax=Nesidiocoris tenuis TaxID=355587 RepID=A0A6H5H620_9HEMI|nr:unnamed protein product [Nesidiocoris tenuis]
MFTLPPDGADDNCWAPQKTAILFSVLLVVRCLVSPSNPGQVTLSCQKALFTSGIFQALTSILMASGVPINFLAEAICTLSEVIRGNHHNQQHFARVMAPISPPREAIVILLMSMVNEKQSFALRCTVLYCFQCYLFKNEDGQAQVVQTLLSPSYSEVNMVTSGQLLCSGLYSHDSLSNWLSAVALSHTLIENPAQRENLLRVLLSPDPNYRPVTLIHQVALLLQQSNKAQSKIGFLIFLGTWLSHCHLAVKHFLEVPTAIPYLTAQVGSAEGEDDNEELVQGLCAFVIGLCILFNDGTASSYDKDALIQLVSNRIGLEVFSSKLSEVSRNEFYSRASKLPQPRATKPEELLLDYEFCKLFKVLESMIVKAVNPKEPSNSAVEIAENGLVSEYKDVIREQDRKIAELQCKCDSLEKEKNQLKLTLEQLSSNVSQLSDENTLLKAQVNKSESVLHLELKAFKAVEERIQCSEFQTSL